MKSTSMQVRLASSAAAVAPSAVMVIGTGALFGTPTHGTVHQLDAVMITPATPSVHVADAGRDL